MRRRWVAPRSGGYAPKNAREPRRTPSGPASVSERVVGDGAMSAEADRAPDEREAGVSDDDYATEHPFT